MADKPLIQVLVGPDSGYGRQVIRGIARFARSQADWRLALPPVGFGSPDLVARLRDADGVIARIVDRRMLRRLRSAQCPVINVSDAIPDLPYPLVTHDPAALAVSAVEHGVERGFVRFAYCGFSNMGYSRARGGALQQACRARGLAFTRHRDVGARSRSRLGEQKRLESWLRTLEAPTLVVCCNDLRASLVVDACRAAGIAIPEDLAVLGMDDDEIVCTTCPVELSSIDVGAEGIGYHAAERLAALLAGGVDDGSVHRMPPAGLVARASTDVLVVADPLVRQALSVMRTDPPPSTVAEVLARVPSSRRALEQRFRALLGRSPLQELNRVRLARACEWLRHSDIPIYAVAERAGYPNANHFATAFRRATGRSPLAWRRAAHP